MMLVHGEQAVELHQPLPVEGEARVAWSTVTGIYDKGSGAVVDTETVATDVATGQPLFTTRSGAFIRGEGGWGGDRGPSGPPNVAPDRAPDNEVSYATRADQALSTACRATATRCTRTRRSRPWPASTGRSSTACAATASPAGPCSTRCAARTRPASARWRPGSRRRSGPATPLTVSMWLDGDGEAIFQTRRNGEQVVIDGGRCTFTA